MQGLQRADGLNGKNWKPVVQSSVVDNGIRRSTRARRRKIKFEEEDLSARAVRVRQQGGCCLAIESRVELELEGNALISTLASKNSKDRKSAVFPKGARCKVKWFTQWRFVDHICDMLEELTKEAREEETSRVLLPRQKDFYALLVQSERRAKKSEHLYSVTSDIGDVQAAPCHISPIDEDGKFEVHGELSFKIPFSVEPGTYNLELGSEAINMCCVSCSFVVAEAFGQVDTTKVGPWCICGCVRSYEETEALIASKSSSVQWVACSSCHSWHHFKCYEFGVMATSQSPIAAVEMKMIGHPPGTPIPAEDEEFICWWCFKYEDHIDSFNLHELFSKPPSPLMLNVSPTPLLVSSSSSSSLVSPVNSPLSNRFLSSRYASPMLMSLEERRLWALGMLETERVERIKSMIQRSSGGYFRKKHDRDGNMIAKRQYCTPNHVVCFLQKLVQVLQTSGAKGLRDFALRKEIDVNGPPPPPMKCVDLGAGDGALTNVLPPGSLAIEQEPSRVVKGEKNVKHCVWLTEDVMEKSVYSNLWNDYDLIVSNPDFEVALNFLVVAHHAMRLDNPDARIIFLLPSDFFEASALRTRIFKVLPIAIELEFKLGHIDYLQHEEGTGAKRSVDSLFVFKRDTSRTEKYVHTLVNARLAGML